MLNYILAYLIGALPSGLIIAKIFNVDLTKSGSGNPGATNVARIIGKKAGIMTLILDVAKGVLACSLSGDSNILGLLAVCGHCFSIPFLLKGGKGVATSLGVLFFINPILSVTGIIVFAVSFYISRIVSLSSIIAALLIGISSIFLSNSNNQTICICLISAIIIVRHYQNIIRLINKTENKFVAKGS